MEAGRLDNVVLLIPTILSLGVHEWAHAMSARALGDDTAEREGRLTLNPLAHVDPLGTFLLPLVQIWLSGFVTFAWARPVPYDPARFRRSVRMTTGSVIVAAAGPLSNLVLALACAVGLGLALRGDVVLGEGVTYFLGASMLINVGLAVFNLLPIPPLDGSKVLHGLLPRRASEAYERLFPYAPLLLLALFVAGDRFVSPPMHALRGMLHHLTAAIAG